MREIRFRAWDGDKNVMHLPEYTDKEDFHILADGTIVETHEHGYERHELTSRRPDTWVLMQFTGLKDKNGKEIYESDIVEAWVPSTKDEWAHKERFTVEFINGSFCATNDKRVVSLSSISQSEPLNKYYQCSAIGNIYENPELIKQESIEAI